MTVRSPRVGVPLLWLCGPMAVGKTTVGHRVFQDVAASVPAAYVDVDQLGLLFPLPPGDPGKDHIKVAALAAVWPEYLAAGARCVVVSGGVGSRRELAAHTDPLPGAVVTAVRLRLAVDEVARRFVARGGILADRLPDALREVGELEGSDGLALAAAAVAARAAAGGWPG